MLVRVYPLHVALSFAEYNTINLDLVRVQSDLVIVVLIDFT